MKNELVKRLLVAAIGIPLIFGAILYGRLPFFIFINVVMVLALWEFYHFVEKKNFVPSRIIGVLSVIALSLDIYLSNGTRFPLILMVTVVFILIVQLFKKNNNCLGSMASSLFGILYVSLFSSFILLRKIHGTDHDNTESGGKIVLLIFIAIWLCDTAAYFFGSKFGKTVLYKRISPKKTWEGSIAGFIMAVASAIIFSRLFIDTFPIIDSIVCGSVIGIFGQISDLVESMIKRDIQIKDSSHILPGHGGILDRFDSSMLIGPILLLYFIIRHYSF